MYSLKSNKRSLTALIVGMGLSMSIYAAGPNPDITPTTSAAPPTATVTTTKTTTEVVKRMRHHHHHKDHMAKTEDSAVVSTSTGSTGVKRTVMKSGVVLNDVEPAAAQPDAPTSTSDTMKGGVTTSMGQ